VFEPQAPGEFDYRLPDNGAEEPMKVIGREADLACKIVKRYFAT